MTWDQLLSFPVVLTKLKSFLYSFTDLMNKANIIHNFDWPFQFPQLHYVSWWRHQMGTFSAILAIYAGNSPGPGEFPAQRSVTRSFDVFFDLRLNKRLSKHSWGWRFETLSWPLWRHCNVGWIDALRLPAFGNIVATRNKVSNTFVWALWH